MELWARWHSKRQRIGGHLSLTFSYLLNDTLSPVIIAEAHLQRSSLVEESTKRKVLRIRRAQASETFMSERQRHISKPRLPDSTQMQTNEHKGTEVPNCLEHSIHWARPSLERISLTILDKP